MNLFRHPTTWVFVDDESRFLDSLKEYLPSDQPALFFDDPSVAENELRAISQRGVTKKLDSHFDIGSLQRFVTDIRRFSQVSVVIADYAMPGCTGIELFEILSDLKIQKILLTGVADESTATLAFNAGTIDRFIKKGERSAVEKILSYSRKLEDLWLSDHQQTLNVGNDMEDALRSNQFAGYFSSQCKQRGIVEYYFCDEPLGFLCLDVSGQQMFFALARERDFMDCLELLRTTDCPAQIIQTVEKREALTLLFETREVVEGYDWSYNTVEIVEVIPGELWGGFHHAPPIDVDYDPSRHSFHALQSEGQ
ncbi:MAG: response regulator [Pseudomonadales bacterium]|nr:response regulator [Pseudomonadales bacterium]